MGGGQAAAGGGVGSSCRAAKQLQRRQKPRCSTPGGSSSCRSAGPLQPHLRSAPDEPDAGLACKSRGQRLFQLPSRCSQARSGRARDPTARRRLHPASELDARSPGCASGGRWGRLAWQLLGLLGGRQWRPGRLGGPDQHFQAFRGGYLDSTGPWWPCRAAPRPSGAAARLWGACRWACTAPTVLHDSSGDGKGASTLPGSLHSCRRTAAAAGAAAANTPALQ